MIKFLLLFVCYLPFICNGQVSFQEKIDEPYDSMGKDIIKLNDTTYIITYSTETVNPGVWNSIILKMNINGTIIWKKRYSVTGFITETSAIVLSTGGFLLLCGATSNSVKVTKLDDSGNIIWNSGFNCNGFGTSVKGIEATDGSYVLSVESGQGLVLVKMDILGNIVWHCSTQGVGWFGNSSTWIFKNGISETSDGGFVGVSLTTAGDAFSGEYKGIVTKVDNNGSMLWTRVIGGLNNDTPTDLLVTNDNSIFVLLHSLSYGVGGEDVLLTKFDQTGNVLWSKTYGSSDNQIGISLKQYDDSSIVITGATGVGSSWNNNKGMLIKIDLEGNLIWSKKINKKLMIHDCEVTSSGNIILVGSLFENMSDFIPFIASCDATGFCGCDTEPLSLSVENQDVHINYDYGTISIVSLISTMTNKSDEMVSPTIICTWDPYFLQVSGDSIICKDDSVTLSAVNDSFFQWATSAEPDNIFSNDSIITVAPNVTTTYLVYGSSDTVSYTVYVDSIPNINLGNDTTICIGDTLILLSSLSNFSGSYLWQNNTTQADLIVQDPGIYWVQATNLCGIGYDSINVIIIDCDIPVEPIIIEMPNVFSPNNDGLNDFFVPVTISGIKSAEIVILNRWGNEVYQSEDVLTGWDGNSSGTECSNGVYFWKITYIDKDLKSYSQNGFLTLTR